MELLSLVLEGNYQAIEEGDWSYTELDAMDEKGFTPVMHAAARGDYQVIEALKRAGANIDLRNKAGEKAVDLAAKHGHSCAIIYLIEGGCGG